MRRVTNFIFILVCTTVFTTVASRSPGALCLDMYDHSLAGMVRIINGQPSSPSDVKILGSKVARLQKYLDAADNGCTGDAVRYKNGMVDSIIRIQVDFRKREQLQNYQGLRDLAHTCTKELSKFLVQPRLRALFLSRVGKTSNGLFRLECQHCLEKHVNFLLTTFYEATGYTISPFVMAYKSLNDPMDDFSEKDLVSVSLEHFEWSPTSIVPHLPIDSVEESFVHCTLLRPTVSDKLRFLLQMISSMGDHWDSLCTAVVKPSVTTGTISDVQYIRKVVSNLIVTLRQPAARRRFELYQSLLFDHVSPSSAPFILHCIALCLCIEIRCFLYNNGPEWYDQYHKLLGIYAPVFGLEDALDKQGVHFDFENEFTGDFFGENMLYKKRFISLMVQIIKQIYSPVAH